MLLIVNHAEKLIIHGDNWRYGLGSVGFDLYSRLGLIWPGRAVVYIKQINNETLPQKTVASINMKPLPHCESSVCLSLGGRSQTIRSSLGRNFKTWFKVEISPVPVPAILTGTRVIESAK